LGFVLMPEPLTAAPVLSIICTTTSSGSSSSSTSLAGQADSTPVDSSSSSSRDALQAPSQQAFWLPQPQLLQLVQAAARSY
jgi:hypothetical protein